MKPFKYLQLFGLACCAGILLSGCFLKPVTVSTRRFVLAPIPPSEHASASAEEFSVGVGFLKMPSYLLKNSMAVRKSATEIDYIEDVLWAERLDHCFQRTLAANLSTLLPSERVYLSAWELDQVRVRVFVNVEQFDVDIQGRGTLIAWWRITAPGSDELLKSGQARLTQTGASPRENPQVIATTLSDLTSEFSRQLAQAIRNSSSAKR
jgi:uncharacterized lipoprotein YmbA